MSAVTDLLNLPKPDSRSEEQESVVDAFLATAAALDMIDAILSAYATSIAGKAEAAHGHAIDAIEGLAHALASKRDKDVLIEFDEVSGFPSLPGVPLGYVLARSEVGLAFLSPAAAIGAHQHAMGEIVGLSGALSALSDDIERATSAGTVTFVAGSTPPDGWLRANGATVSRSAYSDLFSRIGTTFGAGNGSTTFQIPDLRGEFIRGWDDGRGIDGARVLGSSQSDQNKSHVHTGSAESGGAHSHSGSTSTDSHNHTVPAAASDIEGQGQGRVYTTATTGNAWNRSTTSDSHSHSLSINSGGAHTHDLSIDSSGGNEARPRNIALLACIKY
jgi:microcystin-dependent protein|tara:strand:- start:38170 stop:39162 length:993 start_codon:yes stop_codon:yes gene_type:complete